MTSNPYGVTMGSTSASGTFPSAAITDMTNLGITWLRYQIKWSLIDTTGTTNQNTSTYNWNAWDSAVSQCNAAGINIILSIMFAPSQFKTASNPLIPSYASTFASQIATRYDGTHGHGTIQGIEVGNEDYNSSADTTSIPVPIVQQLSLTMKAVYPAVKAVSSAIKVGVACKLQRNSAGYTAFFDTLLNPSTGPYVTGAFQGDYINFHYYTCTPTSGGAPVSLDPTVDMPSWNGGAGLPSITHAWQLIDAKRTQYSNTTPIWMTESGFQINANPGRNTGCNISQATEWTYHQAVLDSLRTSGVVAEWFCFTLAYYAGYPAPNYRDGMSLVQGTLASPTYTTAYNGLKSYISTYPTWTSGSGATFTSSPTSLNFSATIGGSNPANQTVTLSNTGTTSASYTETDSATWLTVSPASGSVAAGSTANSTLSVNISGLAVGTYTGSITYTSGGQNATVAVVLTISSGTPPPPPPGVTPLTAYFTNTASSNLSTANKLYSIGGNPANVNNASLLGTALNYGELVTQGTSSAWAAASIIGGASGYGFLWDNVTLEGNSLQAGTYTAAVRLNMVGVGAVSITADIHCRMYKWNAATGFGLQIADCVLTNQTILTTKTVFAPTFTTSAAIPFGTGDKLYIDLKINVLTNTGPSTASIQLNDLSTDTTGLTGMSTACVVTPGFAPTTTPPPPPGGGSFGVTVGINPGTGNPGSAYTLWTQLFADMQNLGLTWLRFQLSWDSIELTQGSYSWTVLDDAVSHCNAAGIKIWYTIRGAPSWALAPGNGGQLTCSDGWYIMSPSMAAGFATVLMQRYYPGSPHGNLDGLGFNEDFDIHATSTTDTLTLNQTISTAGGPYTSLTINAAGFTPMVGTVLYFGAYGSADHTTVTTNVANGATTVQVASFTPGTTYTAGTSIKLAYVAATSSIYDMYDPGSGGRTTSNPKSQASRNPVYAAAVFNAVAPAIRALNTNILIGMPCTWWLQPINAPTFPGSSVSNMTAFVTNLLVNCAANIDAKTLMDGHYYSNNVDPNAGNGQTSTIDQWVADFQNAANANGFPNLPLVISEFGWQANQNATSSTSVTAGSHTITLDVTRGAAVGGTCLIDTAGSGVQETVTITAKTSTSITATFANAHTQPFPVVINLDVAATGADGQDERYNEVLTSLAPGGARGNKAFFFTLDETQSLSAGSGSSLVLWNGTGYSQQPAYAIVQLFIAGTLVSAPPGTATLTIGNTPVPMVATSLYAKSTVGRRGELSVTVYDALGTNHFQQYQQIALYAGDGTLKFSGYITSPTETKPGFGPLLLTSFTATDHNYLADKRVLAKLYRNQTCGFIVNDILTNILAAEGVTLGQIDAGLVVPIANFGYCTVATALDALVAAASSSGTPFYWMIDQNQQLWFVAYTAVTGPTIDATTVDAGPLSGIKPTVTRANPKYRNTQYAVGGFQETGPWDETRQGDGQTRAFTFSNPLNAAPTTFTLNGSAVTIALAGTSGAQYYWTPNSPVIAQDPSQTILVSTDRLHMIYKGQVSAVFTGQHTDQVAYMASLDGSSGIVEAVLTDPTINSFAQGMSEVGQELTRYCTQGLHFSFATLSPAFAQGQLVTVNYAPFGFSGAQMLIDEVDVSDQQDGFNLWYTITAVQGPYDTNWTQFFGNIVNPGGLGIAQSINIGVAVTQPLYPSTSLFPSTTLYPS